MLENRQHPAVEGVRVLEGSLEEVMFILGLWL